VLKHPVHTGDSSVYSVVETSVSELGGAVEFQAIDAGFDLPRMEERVLSRWGELAIVKAALVRNAGGPAYTFYDGPPTANGSPGVHHVAARVFKDVIPRYRAMKGYDVPRTAGWDCHGIPVELEVERSLGFSAKKDIEAYGIARFNDHCREAVGRNVAEFERLTRRIGYWVDTEEAYWTLSNEYIESVWWSLKTLFDAGLMYEDHRVGPYCPRCGTTLSDHEVAQGYQDVTDQSVYVRLPLLSGPLARTPDRPGADLLVWTTMPWTFMATTAAVIGPAIQYVLADGGKAADRPVVLAEELLERALGPDARIRRRISHDEILGARYRGPFDYVGPGSLTDVAGDPSSWRVVVTGEFVTVDQGTGIVSTGAAFGEEDMAVARANGLPVVNPVTREGRFDERCGPFAGVDVRQADPLVIDALQRCGLLVAVESYKHSYPFCWRCSTPLIYYAKPSWYLATTRVKQQMITDNAKATWQPEHIGSGRYGAWLSGNIDWAISRERYWGTPLPLWRCAQCGHVQAVGSKGELATLSGADLTGCDLHRPAVDEIVLPCPRCGGSSERVAEVLDAWYDSGSMSFAQHGYPHRPGSEEKLRKTHPADFICEGIDQTRGWFYSLQAVSTLVMGTPAYRHAQCLGHIVDAFGKKMSKSAGNVLDPWQLIDAYGADALRWLLLVDGNPWQPRTITDDAIAACARRTLLTLWNVYSFFITYARQARWTGPGSSGDVTAEQPLLDRYVLGDLRDLVAESDAAYEACDATRAGRHIADFVDVLSNWYLRLSRQRFASATEPADSCAFETLWRCLSTLSYLLAPLVPFFADALYDNLVLSVDPAAPVSVHLADFPGPDTVPAPPRATIRELQADMADARHLVALGRKARQSAGVPTRHPLARAAVVVPAERLDRFAVVAELVKAELNVVDCHVLAADHPAIVREVRPKFRELGKEFGKDTPTVVAALEQLDAGSAADQLHTSGRLLISGPGGDTIELTAEMVTIAAKPAPGWAHAADNGYAVMLDVVVDDQLRRQGTAREFVRLLSELRKSAGLQYSDTAGVAINVLDDPDGILQAVLGEQATDILRAVRGTAGTEGRGATRRTAEISGGRVAVAIWPA
jgi:isoleucyl-tRNA synthetase